MKKQITAVEWLIEQLKINNYISENAHWLIDDAKQMEREQLNGTKKQISFTEPNIIDKWLEENGSAEIAKQVEKEVKELCKKETLEEASIRAAKSGLFKNETLFIAGAKWQQEQTIEEIFKWLTTNNYLTDLKETMINNFKNK